MKFSQPQLACLSVFILFSSGFAVASAADTNPPPRVLVELRDGSRVVGESGKNMFKFHSALLGEIRLKVEDIRLIECVSSNSARLTTVNGDTLTARCLDSEYMVKTSFGKLALPVDSIRKFTVSSARRSGLKLEGLVALWSGEGDALDSVGKNNGELRRGVKFAPGKVGLAFSLDGNAFVEVPSSPEITPGGPFTITAWVNYLRMSGSSIVSVPIVSKGQDVSGAIDWCLAISSNFKLRPHLNVGGDWVFFDCASPLVPGTWYHVAMVYDGASLRGYVNGRLDGSQAVSGAVQATEGALKIGAYSPLNGGDSGSLCLPGQIDEVSLFSRALSDAEICENFEAGKN